MRRLSLPLTLLTVAGLAACAIAEDAPSRATQAAQATPETPAVTALAIGSKAPMTDVKMKNVDGKDVTIAGLKGTKGTLVVFTCNACPFAKAWEQRIVTLGNTWSKKGIGVIAINPNDPAKVAEDGYAQMKERAKARKMAFPYAVDASSDIARAYGATRTPEAFLFDAEGTLVYHGAVDDNRDAAGVKTRYLEEAIKAIAAGQAVPTAETKSVGCTIKWRNAKA